MKYAVLLTYDPVDEVYGVVVPWMEGTYTFGDTREEALANAREAITLTLECDVAEGRTISDHEYLPDEIAFVDVDVPTIEEADANESGYISLVGVEHRFGHKAYVTVMDAIIAGTLPYRGDTHLVRPMDVKALLAATGA